MSYPSQNPSQPQGEAQFPPISPGHGSPAQSYPPPGQSYPSQVQGYPQQPQGYPPHPQYAPPPPAYGPPQPGYYVQPAPPAPPAPPRKKKSSVGLIIGVIAAVLAIVCGGAIACSALLANSVPTSSGNGSGTENGAGTENGSGTGNGGGNEAAVVGLNQPARDGKFEFTVSSVQCGAKRLGSASFGQDAQGQFCLVKLTVKNIGDKAQDFFGSNIYGFNAAGQKYEVDSGAALYLDDAKSFYEKINPGNTVNGTIIFDIPTDQALKKLELHDSAFSGGVIVTL